MLYHFPESSNYLFNNYYLLPLLSYIYLFKYTNHKLITNIRLG